MLMMVVVIFLTAEKPVPGEFCWVAAGRRVDECWAMGPPISVIIVGYAGSTSWDVVPAVWCGIGACGGQPGGLAAAGKTPGPWGRLKVSTM